jgi:hypothetical protein
MAVFIGQEPGTVHCPGRHLKHTNALMCTHQDDSAHVAGPLSNLDLQYIGNDNWECDHVPHYSIKTFFPEAKLGRMQQPSLHTPLLFPTSI